jgi:hypothetical protein
MNERNITFNIEPYECVGDSLGKHNFNFLGLDSLICNLSSLFFSTSRGNIPLLLTVRDLSSNQKSFNDNLTQMTNTFRFDRTYTGLNLLSSYWERHDTTISYPNDRTAGNYFVYNTSETFMPYMTATCLRHINLNYPASSYKLNAFFNVVVPVYSNLGSNIISYTYTNLDGNSVNTPTMPSFSLVKDTGVGYDYRQINAYYSKGDNNFWTNVILTFENKNKREWSYKGYINDAVKNTLKTSGSLTAPISGADPNPSGAATIEVPYYNPETGIATTLKFVEPNPPLGQRTTLVKGNARNIIFNQYYNRDLYFSVEAISQGGSLTLTFLSQDGKIFTYEYTEKNSGMARGTYQSKQIILGWDLNQVYAKEDGVIVKTWVMPIPKDVAVNFIYREYRGIGPKIDAFLRKTVPI